MIKLQIGGSPCTHWSIAQTKNRETEPEGIGWELLENYLIALDKFQPDYFLYENNKSMSKEIREEITRRFGFEPVCINSARVSAQNRQRLYWCGERNPDGIYSRVDVPQPEDKGLLLKDIVIPAEEIPPEYWYNCPWHFTGAKSGDVVHLDIRGTDAIKRVYSIDYKCPTLTTCGGGHRQAKVFQDGKPRRLRVLEYKRLQTVPDSYAFPVSDTQAYKMLGNGWTVDVIAHILSHCRRIATEHLDVLSMYDGMACGHIALDKMGATIARYRATEIDKYAIKTACHNFPDIEQLGDAFQVREW
jgi:DNA (cytosine-5)-methyltransferase 3A